MRTTININSSAVVKHTNRLEQMKKVDLPLAIRGTLNRAAFDVKQRTMPVSAAQFTSRKANFFRANSKVDMATGFNVNSMKSMVGFTTQKAGYNHAAVRELEEQEYGGDIHHRDFVPVEGARVGENYSSEVKAKNRLETIGTDIKAKAVFVKNQKGSTRKQKFIRAAIKAGRGGYVIGGLRKQMLYRIESVSKKSGRAIVKQKALYSFEEGRSVKIKGTGFMRNASLRSANKLEVFYAQEAARRFAKIK